MDAVVALMDEKQVSELTGVSVQTLRRNRLAAKGIPYLRLGRLVRYRIADILAYLDSCRVEVSK